MGNIKQTKKKKSHTKVSKSKKKSNKRTKKKLKNSENANRKQSPDHTTEFCLECNSNLHTSVKCPNIWRKYILKEKTRDTTKMVLPIHTIYCFRCGAKGHYGDDCHVYSDTKHLTTERSAFSGKNLERPLSDMYYNILLKQRESFEVAEDDATSYNKLNIFPFYKPPYTTTKRIK